MRWYGEWAAGWDSGRVALRFPGRTLSYADLDRRVRKATGWLSQRGVGSGQVVALAMPKGPDWLAVHFATLRLGAVSLPLNERYTMREFAYPLQDAPATLAILPDEIATQLAAVPASSVSAGIDAAEPYDPPVPDEASVVLLLYTSGTTGRPKGVPLQARHLRGTVDALRTAWGWRPDDVLLHALPLYHVHGLLVAAYGALSVGATIEGIDRFDAPEVVARLAQGGVTVFMGVPTFYTRMLACEPVDLSHVRLMTSGSAGLPTAVHRGIRDRFGVSVVERYGMTEVGIVVSNDVGNPVAGAIGRPLPGVSVRIVDEGGGDVAQGTVGELCVRGPGVFDGYHRLPGAGAFVDGHFCSGDLGRRDADGVIHLVGRRSELILVGGLNVYPAEVEDALCSLPGVEDAAVTGLPDDDLGEVPAAVVVGQVDPATLAAQLRGILAPYKIPRRIERVAALPRNAMGKVLKSSLFAPAPTMLGGRGEP